MFPSINTKRCVYCQQLSPVEAEICQHCARRFMARGSQLATRTLARASITTASSHQAGHHPGLHPEDQPYQSSMMAAQQSPVLMPPAEAAWEASEATIPVPRPRPAPQAVVPPQTWNPPTHRFPPPHPYLPKKPGPQGKAMPAALIGFCMALLVVGSLFAYKYISQRGSGAAGNLVLTATPEQLHVGETFTLAGRNFGPHDVVSFAHDSEATLLSTTGQALQVYADEQGAFSLQVVVPATWSAGTHRVFATDIAQQASISTSIMVLSPVTTESRLQIASTTLDLGAGAPGMVSRKSLLLRNSGGGTLSWSASSDQSWLKVEPQHGTFVSTAIVMVSVDRAHLSLKDYSGELAFNQPDSTSTPLVVLVKMKVKGASGLVLSTDGLSYNASEGQNPPEQTLTLQNSSDQALDWSSSVSTANNVSWLSVTPAGGHLEPGSRMTVTVQVLSQQLPIGSYQGTLTINGSTAQQISVSLNVAAPANLLVPSSLTLTATAGKNGIPQALTLQNNGGQPLDWQLITDTESGGSWLSASPASGHLEPGAGTQLTVTANATKLGSGSYQGSLTFSGGALTRESAIFLTVLPSALPGIAVSPGNLDFKTTQGSNPAPQTFTLSNPGSAPLHWALSISQSGPPFLAVSPQSGSLDAGKNITITVTPSVDQMKAGQQVKATIKIFDAKGEPGVRSRLVSVTVTIQG